MSTRINKITTFKFQTKKIKIQIETTKEDIHLTIEERTQLEDPIIFSVTLSKSKVKEKISFIVFLVYSFLNIR